MSAAQPEDEDVYYVNIWTGINAAYGGCWSATAPSEVTVTLVEEKS